MPYSSRDCLLHRVVILERPFVCYSLVLKWLTADERLSVRTPNKGISIPACDWHDSLSVRKPSNMPIFLPACPRDIVLRRNETIARRVQSSRSRHAETCCTYVICSRITMTDLRLYCTLISRPCEKAHASESQCTTETTGPCSPMIKTMALCEDQLFSSSYPPAEVLIPRCIPIS